ncbi:6-phosphogluconate dehydrogenase [Hyaloraphidium curvatum]|nr:6-phosphogluconate dehydrogenase [Hyaloraphidium curvatum]
MPGKKPAHYETTPRHPHDAAAEPAWRVTLPRTHFDRRSGVIGALKNAGPAPPDARLNVVVCGCGSGAQTAAAVMAALGHTVHIYMSPSYEARAQVLHEAIVANGGIILESQGKPGATGPVLGVSSDAAELLPAADIIVISLNGPRMDALIRELAPHMRPRHLLVYLPAMGAVNYLQLKSAMKEHAAATGHSNALVHLPLFAATRTLPWACRIIAPAHINLCGTKAVVDMALAPGAPKEEAAAVRELLNSLFPGTTFLLNPQPIETSFIPFDALGNPVLHPGIMYGTWSSWDGHPVKDKPTFYRGVSEFAVEVVESLQSEAQAVIAALAKQIGLEKPPEITDLHTDLYNCYSDHIGDPSTLYTLLRTNGAYEGIFHPMVKVENGWVPDFNSRLLSEDVPCGLVAIKGVGDILDVPTPWIRKVIEWGQEKMGKEYVVDGKLVGKDMAGTGAPQTFGIEDPDRLLVTSLEYDIALERRRRSSVISAEAPIEGAGAKCAALHPEVSAV